MQGKHVRLPEALITQVETIIPKLEALEKEYP
jgi:hypothetical protein